SSSRGLRPSKFARNASTSASGGAPSLSFRVVPTGNRSPALVLCCMAYSCAHVGPLRVKVLSRIRHLFSFHENTTFDNSSTTSDTSPTGQRYINHASRGHTILLFVREYKG